MARSAFESEIAVVTGRAEDWTTINSSSKSWTTVRAFLRMPSRICSSLFSRPNPSVPAPALASSSAIASSATVMGAKSNLNPAPVKRALECGFPSTARNLPTCDQADTRDDAQLKWKAPTLAAGHGHGSLSNRQRAIHRFDAPHKLAAL